jgi:hypothetical protein
MVSVKPILKWQYTQITKELLLLQNHASDPTCPCKSEGEMCVRKHLLLIEALAEETSTIEDDPEKIKYLAKLTAEAKAKRDNEEKKLCGGEAEPEDLSIWARDERKIVESWSLACELRSDEPLRTTAAEPANQAGPVKPEEAQTCTIH